MLLRAATHASRLLRLLTLLGGTLVLGILLESLVRGSPGRSIGLATPQMNLQALRQESARAMRTLLERDLVEVFVDLAEQRIFFVLKREIAHIFICLYDVSLGAVRSFAGARRLATAVLLLEDSRQLLLVSLLYRCLTQGHAYDVVEAGRRLRASLPKFRLLWIKVELFLVPSRRAGHDVVLDALRAVLFSANVAHEGTRLLLL